MSSINGAFDFENAIATLEGLTDFQEVVNQTRDLLARDIDVPDQKGRLYIILAKNLRRLSKLGSAEDAIAAGLNLNIDCSVKGLLQAQKISVLIAKKRLEEAKNYAEEVQKSYPKKDVAWLTLSFYLAQVYNALRFSERAEKVVREALQSNISLPEVQETLCIEGLRALYGQKKYCQLLVLAGEILNFPLIYKASTDIKVRVILYKARALTKQKRFQKAEAEFIKAIEMKPRSSRLAQDLFMFYSECLWDMNDYDPVRLAFRKVRKEMVKAK